MQYLCVYVCVSYPERAVGHIDVPPADNDGVFNGLDRSVRAQIGAISLVSDLDFDGAAFGILSYKSMSTLACTDT